MSKFKVGDIVRRINYSHGSMQIDDVDTIVGVAKDGKYKVAGDADKYPDHGHDGRNLELSPGAGEVDPAGLSAATPGAKLDAGKVMAAQILSQFPRALLGVAEVGSFGARKYSMGGWQKVENGFARYEDAQFRHFLKRNIGETVDPDSNLDHLKHEAWNALAKLELYLRGKEKA